MPRRPIDEVVRDCQSAGEICSPGTRVRTMSMTLPPEACRSTWASVITTHFTAEMGSFRATASWACASRERGPAKASRITSAHQTYLPVGREVP